MSQDTHRRYNPLLKRWVLVSPHRTKRPWQGELISAPDEPRNNHDPQCYLCPRNVRANGEINPDYSDVFSFVNDFSALLPEAGSAPTHEQPYIQAEPASGICKVICFSPRHDLTLAEMDEAAILKVIIKWQSEYSSLAEREDIKYVTVFENKGAMMGCSNPHPHGQIWATSYLPSNPSWSFEAQQEHIQIHGKPLIQDYVSFEEREKKRIIGQNEHWIAVVPFWAEWPYEVMVAPKRRIPSLVEMNLEEARAWAALMKTVTVKFDNLFKTSFPYSMGIYQKPCDGNEWDGASLYQVFLPPLLRSATIRKYMVGFEMIAESQRDITAEAAAEKLRDLDDTHYLETGNG